MPSYYFVKLGWIAAILFSAFLFPLTRRSSLAAVHASNSGFTPSYTPVAVFVGGTSGIGQGVAEAFARHTHGNAHIIIVGRNHAAAQSIIERFPKPAVTTGITHEFIECDVTRMRNVQAVTREILTRVPKVNFLVMTPGIATLKGRDETEEGIDKKLALHYYARWKFTNDLIPAILGAKDAGEDAKVLSVMSAGRGGKIDLGDLGLKETYSLRNVAQAAPVYNDLMMEEFSMRYPQLTFVHAYPGPVRTPLMKTSDSVLIRAAAYIVRPLFSTVMFSPEYTGEFMLHGLLNSTQGFKRIGSTGEDMGMKNYYGSELARRRLWEHTVNETRVPNIS
ncbi:hypothetical protein BDZ94DRAFT_1264641 [Collybia nuda]|uniref:NAD(P)-binding protein n=1 Tax=Collybia nuda TaxID=64659 RepID=A0A9P5Y294_9AGAR|nr:hypothetical protein BDZ94DRAFT_1264641 [Collybia nuda]